EMKEDRAYLARLAGALGDLRVSTELAMGDPATELIRLAEERKVDLIAMSTHGHRFLNDLLRGTTVNKVRHVVGIPVLLLRAKTCRSDPRSRPRPESSASSAGCLRPSPIATTSSRAFSHTARTNAGSVSRSSKPA